MDKEPGGGFGLKLAAVGMGLCCALPLLLVSGGFGAALAWLFDEGVVWLVAALALVAGGLILRYRRGADRAKRSDDHFIEPPGDRTANAGEDPRSIRTPDASE